MRVDLDKLFKWQCPTGNISKDSLRAAAIVRSPKLLLFVRLICTTLHMRLHSGFVAKRFGFPICRLQESHLYVYGGERRGALYPL